MGVLHNCYVVLGGAEGYPKFSLRFCAKVSAFLVFWLQVYDFPMVSKLVSSCAIIVILVVTAFGLYVMLLQPMHHGCPLMSVQDVICSDTVFEHISLWQTLFASTLSSIVFLFACAILVVRGEMKLICAHERVRYRLHATFPYRPTLFQELFSRGIHNRKEP